MRTVCRPDPNYERVICLELLLSRFIVSCRFRSDKTLQDLVYKLVPNLFKGTLCFRSGCVSGGDWGILGEGCRLCRAEGTRYYVHWPLITATCSVANGDVALGTASALSCCSSLLCLSPPPTTPPPPDRPPPPSTPTKKNPPDYVISPLMLSLVEEMKRRRDFYSAHSQPGK